MASRTGSPPFSASTYKLHAHRIRVEVAQIEVNVEHRLRQSGIDEELFDVVAGFEALSGKQRDHPS